MKAIFTLDTPISQILATVNEQLKEASGKPYGKSNKSVDSPAFVWETAMRFVNAALPEGYIFHHHFSIAFAGEDFHYNPVRLFILKVDMDEDKRYKRNEGGKIVAARMELETQFFDHAQKVFDLPVDRITDATTLGTWTDMVLASYYQWKWQVQQTEIEGLRSDIDKHLGWQKEYAAKLDEVNKRLAPTLATA